MKSKSRLLFILLALAVTACSAGASQSPGQGSGSLPDSQSMEQPPTPYPDTPAPVRVDAPLIENPSILNLDMVNELDGWAVTETEIARTNDGGLSWYSLTPPDMQETGYSVDTFFLDEVHAWVLKPDLENFPYSGRLSRTTDGGRTWSEYSVPFSRGDLTFLDADSGWMLAELGVGAGSNPVAVFQTLDGGRSWRRTYTNDPNEGRPADSLPLGGLKSDLVPLDMSSAWVTGVAYAPGDVFLYRTFDGGRNWQPVSLAPPPGTEWVESGIDDDGMKFVSPTEGFLVLRVSNGSLQTAVYVTRDAGKTWSLTPTLIRGAGPSSFLTAQEAVIYNGEQFHVTRDAAQSWVVVPPDVSFGETFAGMEFVNTMSGWVITMDPSNHRSLYRTYDGGSTWLPVIP